MTDAPRIQNCYRLCQSTLRNAAYYRGAASLGSFNISKQFAVAIRNNFLDMAFLDWCKLFADKKKGKHHWRKVLMDEASFMSGLLSELGVTETKFDDFTESVALYRNKVIAHADIYNTIDIPMLDFMVNCTIHLYEQLREGCGCEPHPVAPSDLHATFKRVVNEGRSMFEKLLV